MMKKRFVLYVVIVFAAVLFLFIPDGKQKNAPSKTEPVNTETMLMEEEV